jgi:hypothetical protein
MSQWVTGVMRRAARLMGMDHAKAANLKVGPHMFRYESGMAAASPAACQDWVSSCFRLRIPALQALCH